MSNVREIPQPIYDGWKLTQFSETVLAPISGRRPKGGASSESGTIPSVGGEHITNGGILDFSNTKFIPEDYFERIKSFLMRPSFTLNSFYLDKVFIRV